ncbi:hypothetical protein GCM10011375_08690 [Hymenobacter qilianensis]|nr:hypothetical protein [Hymenobacter qilianensis]GGF55817.1 hypothetical protein GCM10011375_08690 [Hymenobacter qilianensis]
MQRIENKLFKPFIWLFVEASTKTMKENAMQRRLTPSSVIGWVFGIVVFAIGVANVFLVHPVPGIVYLFLSLIYFPPANALLKEKTGFYIPRIVKIILGIIIIQFTLGVSDLGDMIDDVFINK